MHDPSTEVAAGSGTSHGWPRQDACLVGSVTFPLGIQGAYLFGSSTFPLGRQGAYLVGSAAFSWAAFS